MKVEFEIRLAAKDLYKFNMRQAYRGMQGALSIILPVLIFLYAGSTFGQVSLGSTLIYTGLGVVFLVYVPISLWLRVQKIVTDPANALSKSLHYTFTESAIRVQVEDESVEFQWENIYMMKQAGNLLLVYTNRINAYILPLEQVGEQYESLSALAHKKLQKHRISMR